LAIFNFYSKNFNFFGYYIYHKRCPMVYKVQYIHINAFPYLKSMVNYMSMCQSCMIDLCLYHSQLLVLQRHYTMLLLDQLLKITNFIISFKKFDSVFNSYGMMILINHTTNSCICMFLLPNPNSMAYNKYMFQLNL
jgi:hypothetical protein